MVHDSDLTGRARIREAALEEFAAHGMRGATMRAIASRAATSPGLVQHHFGTKEKLRQACDEHVVSFVRDKATTAFEEGKVGDPAYLAEVFHAAPRIQRYLARALVDDSPQAAALFDQLVALTAEHVTGSGRDDGGTDDRALVLTAMRLGVVVLHQHVARALGSDVFDPDMSARIAHASLDVLNSDLLGPGTVQQARAGLDSYQHQQEQS